MIFTTVALKVGSHSSFSHVTSISTSWKGGQHLKYKAHHIDTISELEHCSCVYRVALIIMVVLELQ